MFYAAHNSYADTRNGNRGFMNSWEVSRFPTRIERDAFVARFDHKLAKPVTRTEANRIWRSTYLCVGDPIPRGGLFNPDSYSGPASHFWNENAFAELLA